MLFQLRLRIESRRCGQNPFAWNPGCSLRDRIGVVLFLFVALGLHAPRTAAQELDPAAMLKPAMDTWPTYNGDYSGKRFSTLDQINAANVGSLTLAWAFPAHGNLLKSTPLEVN